jgi:small-conductance mechanosensitive channel
VKRIILAVSITALIVTVVLVAMEAYYIAVALAVGTMIMGHREVWSLVRRRKLPAIDERVRENLSKSVRNAFLFLAMALAFLMLPFGTTLAVEPEPQHILGGLFLSGGVVYLLSYIYYDRAGPRSTERRRGMLKTFLIVAGIAVATFIISVFLHNAISALFDIEEAVFFVIAVVISPLALLVGLVGSLVLFVMGLVSNNP